jgi:DNA mismatch repair protein MutS
LARVPVKNSPLIAQYLSVKQKVPDAILFFRLGDFYEMLFEDAEVGARVLDIQLTSRSKDGVPLCGVPYHSAEPYIAKLLKAGLKVAICEQTQPEPRPRAAAAGQVFGSDEPFQLTPPRGLMPRQIVRVITPGTVGEENVLAAGEKSFLLAFGAAGAGDSGFALAALDVSTGEFLATRIAGVVGVREEIARIAPREIVAPKGDAALAALLESVDCPVTWLDGPSFAAERPRQALAARFGAETDDALGEALSAAAGAALVYVEETFGRELAHLRAPQLYRAAEYMLVDEVSRRHLELVVSSDGTRRGSLRSVLDETLTPVGARCRTGSYTRCSASMRFAPAMTRSRNCSKRIWAAKSPRRSAGLATSSVWRDESGACARPHAIASSWIRRCARSARCEEFWNDAKARLSAVPLHGWCRCPNWPGESTRRSATSRRSIHATAM